MCISPVIIRNPNDRNNCTYFGRLIYNRYQKEISEGKHSSRESPFENAEEYTSVWWQHTEDNDHKGHK